MYTSYMEVYTIHAYVHTFYVEVYDTVHVCVHTSFHDMSFLKRGSLYNVNLAFHI